MSMWRAVSEAGGGKYLLLLHCTALVNVYEAEQQRIAHANGASLRLWLTKANIRKAKVLHSLLSSHRNTDCALCTVCDWEVVVTEVR